LTSEGVDYIKNYFSQYWNRVQEALSFIPPEYLPEFMKITRKLVIYECVDGYLTFMYSDTSDVSESSYQTTRRVQDVFNGQVFYDEQGNRVPKYMTFQVQVDTGGVEIAEPEIQAGKKIFRPNWLVAYILVKREPSESLRVDPTKRAEKDIRTFLLERRLGIKDTASADRNQRNEKVITVLEELLKDFRLLLDDATKEEELQQFIETNSILIDPISQIEDVHPKYQLGKEYITDFIIEHKRPMPFSHTCVEIEPASESLFLQTKGREMQLTQRTNHAVDQLQDWRIWIRDNVAYLKNDFPTFDQCRYVLVIGRGDSLTVMQKRKLAELNAEHNWRIVYTYDDLADRLEQLINNLKGIKTDC